MTSQIFLLGYAVRVHLKVLGTWPFVVSLSNHKWLKTALRQAQGER